MALNALGLGLVFTAKDLAGGVITKLERKFISLEGKTSAAAKAFKASVGDFGTGLATLTVGAGIVAGAFALASPAAKFEQAIAGVGAVANASASELELLRNAALEAGNATQYDPIEATRGLKELTQAGYGATDSVKLLIPVLDLAAGSLGELSPETAAGLAAQTLKAFGLEAKDAADTVDRLLKSANLFALTARDLPLALGIASRGANTLNQSLTETLVAVGLVKNIIPTVERSSTSVAVAMERLANPKHANQIRRIGVAVTDAQGKFRPFLDIIGDMIPKLEQMTEEQRAAFLTQTLGARALGGFNAIMKQVKDGITTHTGETYKGAAAIRYLRQQFDAAGGTAEKFRERLLNTLEGQKQLLRGAFKTLGIAIGDPFAQVFKPIVSGIVSTVRFLAKAIEATPAPIKKLLAALIVLAGAAAFITGAIIAAKAAFVLFSLASGIVGGALAGVATLLGTVAAVIAGVIAAVLLLRVVFERDIGGIGTFARKTFETVQLVFDAFAQVFRDGGFSGPVLQELNKAENAGIKRFVVVVSSLFYRLGRFAQGVFEGFGNLFEVLGPPFEMLKQAFALAFSEIGKLLVQLGLLDGSVQGSSDTWKTVGAVIGATIGAVIRITAFGIGLVIQGFALGIRIVGVFVAAINAIGEIIAGVGGVIWGLITGDFTLAWESAKGIVFAFARFFVAVIATITETIEGLVSSIASVFGVDLGKGRNLRAEMEATIAEWEKPGAAGAALQDGRPRTRDDQRRGILDPVARPAVAASEALVTGTAGATAARPPDNPEIVVQSTLMLDGQVIADAVDRVRSRDKDTGFRPLGRDRD